MAFVGKKLCSFINYVCFLPACVLCCCACSPDDSESVEHQLMCFECMNGFHKDFPCFGTYCGNLFLKRLLNSEGTKQEDFVNEDCSFFCVCVTASSGLFIDTLLCPVYCGCCIATTLCCPSPPPVKLEEDTNVKFPSTIETTKTQQPTGNKAPDVENTENPVLRGKEQSE